MVLIGSGPTGVSITLTQIKYRTRSAPFSGTATMEVSAGVHSESRLEDKRSSAKSPAETSKPRRSSEDSRSVAVGFENLEVDPSGLATAGVITLVAPLSNLDISSGPLTHHAGPCGINVTLEAKAKITKNAPGEVITAGPMAVELPYRDAKGKPAAFANFQTNGNGGITLFPKDPKDKTDTLFELHDTGQLRFHLSGGRAVPGHADNFDVSGFNFKPETVNVDLPLGAVPSTLTVTIPSCLIQCPLPNLFTQDEKPLPLTATNVVILSGKPTFKINAGKVANSTPMSANADGKQVHSPDPTIPLVRPLDFGLCIHTASVNVAEGVLSAFTLDTVDLVLPEQVVDAPLEEGLQANRIGLNRVDLMKPGGLEKITLAPGQQVVLHFAQTHGLTAERSAIFLDLSPDGPAEDIKGEIGVGGAKWEGLYIKTLKVDGIEGVDCFVDGFGFTGAVTAPKTLTVGNYTVSNVKGQETFRRNALDSGGSYTGTLGLPGCTFPNSKPPAGAAAGLAVGGSFRFPQPPTVVINGNPQQELMTKEGLSLTISAGAIADGPEALSVTGVLQLPNPTLSDQPSKFPLPFQDLPVGSDGTLNPPGGSLQFSQPTEMNFHAFKLHAQSISGFKGEGNDTLVLQGPVEMAGDLPLSHPEQFPGVQLKGGNLNLTAVQNFALDVDLAGIGRIKGSLHYDATDPSGPEMKGMVDFQLGGDGGDGSDAGLGGAALSFVVGDGAWYVQGAFDLPTAIPIPSTGLDLRAFSGGFGRNISFTPGDKGRLTDITLARNNSNFFFTVGVRVAAKEQDLLWFDVILNVQDNPLLIDLEGRVYVNEKYRAITQPLPAEETLSSYADADIIWDGAAKSFRASADAHLAFPDRKTPLITADGSMELVVAPGDQHFYLGWPFPERAVNITAFGNTLEGGTGIVLKPSTSFGAAFKESFSFGPLSGEIDGTIYASYSSSLAFGGTVHASGEVDFCVFTVGAEASLNAELTDKNLHISGEFTGYIDTWFGDISASVGIDGHLPPL